jgi:hypothetical protein
MWTIVESVVVAALALLVCVESLVSADVVARVARAAKAEAVTARRELVKRAARAR